MARNEYHHDTRIRRRHVPLITQQRRLRHLTSIAARNMAKGQTVGAVGTFFTLHLQMKCEAFYTSEIDPDCINPTWRNFNVSSFPDDLDSSSRYVIVKVWLQMTEPELEPILIIEWCTYFSGLLFYGEKIPKDAKRFQPNSILFGASEGYYGPPDSLLPCKNTEEPEYPLKETIPVDASSIRISCSVNTVNRIQTVQRAIKQTQASVRRIRKSIQERLARSQVVREAQASREMQQMRVNLLMDELHRIRTRTRSNSQLLSQEEQQLQDSSMEQMSKFQSLKKEKESLSGQKRDYYEARERLGKTMAELVQRRKLLISELSRIYPIVEFPDKKGYSICAICLPYAEEIAGHDETMIAAALGYVSHVLLMISWFLNVPLRYPLRYFGSQSCISDHLVDRIPDKEREFPLYSRGREKTHFQYGVYLLNRNVAQLRQYLGLATNNLQATLANVYSLLQLRLTPHSDPSNTNFHISPATAKLQINGTVASAPRTSVALPLPCVGWSSTTDSPGKPEISTRREVDQWDGMLSRSLDKGLNGVRSCHGPSKRGRHGSAPNLLTLAGLQFTSKIENEPPKPSSRFYSDSNFIGSCVASNEEELRRRTIPHCRPKPDT